MVAYNGIMVISTLVVQKLRGFNSQSCASALLLLMLLIIEVMVAYNGIMVMSTLVVQKLRGWREVADRR